MTANTVTYNLPVLHTLRIDGFEKAPEFNPELIMLDKGSGKGTRFLRPYRVCYLIRRSTDLLIRSHNERDKVNLASLCTKRAALIHPIIKGLLEGHSGIPDFNSIETAFDWIDRQGRSAELYAPEGIRRLYQDYTDHLRHRLRLSNVGEGPKSIAYPTAQKRQAAMAYVCGLASECDVNVVMSWAIQIPQKKMGSNELPGPATTADEHALAYALHKCFFDAFSKAVLKKSAPPVVVELSDLGFEDLIYYSQFANNRGGWSAAKKEGRTDWKPYFYGREGVFEGDPKAFNALLAENGIAPNSNSGFAQHQKNNRQFSHNTLREMANHATRHFGYLLLAAAGNNAAHLASINCNQLRLDKALGLASTRAIKARAGFEDQEQHVDLHFAQTIWKQYLKLREWMAQQLQEPPKLGLFLLSGQADRAPYNLLTSVSIVQLPLWPVGAPSLATRVGRKHKTVNLMEGSGGNTALVAGMQYATPRTIERHYNFKNRQEAVEALCAYFAAQAEAAELRYLGIKPVRIIDGGETTHSGYCDVNTDDPRLMEGFEELGIEPRCGAPITCIFCVHFGLHADTEDMLRLLTISCWIEVQSRLNSINIDDYYQKFVPYANRIQQILLEISTNSGEISKRLKDAKARFELGERDAYWNAKINALLEMDET